MNTAKELPPESVPEIRSRRQSMAEHDLRQRVEVSDDGRTVATAEVTASEGLGGTVRVSLHAEPGHITRDAARAWSMLCWIFPRRRKARAWRQYCRLAMAESLHRLQERFQGRQCPPIWLERLLPCGPSAQPRWQRVPDPARDEPPPGAS